ncbi:MAG TPA: polysaccharide deacetylase family protein [Ignavibacteria bacterium]|nr:polysaccharide deacetylase family protein [Ignavibacteria bacterium]
MNITKRTARKFIFPTLMKLGIDKFIRNSAKDAYLNLMYHGVVLKDGSYFSPRHITSDQFESHLKYYRKNFDIISISEAFYNIRNNIKPKKKTITISFDDGYKNNFNVALTLLEKYNIPTTFFVSSVCTEDMNLRCLWSDIIAALNYFYKDKVIQLSSYDFKNLFDKEKRVSITELFKSYTYDERERRLKELINAYDLDTKIQSLPEELWKFMSPEEVIELSQSDIVEIGSHGHLHYNLGEIEVEKAKEELVKSKKLLESLLNKEVNLIAYPDGSYNDDIKNLSKEAGYKGQLAVNYKTITDYKDKRIMNRYGLSSTTTYESNMIFLNLAFQNKGVI